MGPQYHRQRYRTRTAGFAEQGRKYRDAGALSASGRADAEKAFVAKSRSGAADDAVQRFFADGQLCHLITTISLDGNSAAWARRLTTGMRHP
jgi:hypothetical protein